MKMSFVIYFQIFLKKKLQNNNKFSILDIDLLKNKKVLKIEQYGKFLVFKYLNNYPCYNNISNDYIPNKNEIQIFKFLKNKKLNMLYKINNLNEEYYAAKILLNKKYRPGVNLNQEIENIPLHLALNIKKTDKNIYFRLFSFQLRNNANIGGHLAGYTFQNIKFELLNKSNDDILKIIEFKDINFGKYPTLLKSPFDLTLPNDFTNKSNLILRITFQNINNNIEWDIMNDFNSVIINLDIQLKLNEKCCFIN